MNECKELFKTCSKLSWNDYYWDNVVVLFDKLEHLSAFIRPDMIRAAIIKTYVEGSVNIFYEWNWLSGPLIYLSIARVNKDVSFHISVAEIDIYNIQLP